MSTTPYRLDMNAHQSPHHTPSRRALGDLTPRAINSPVIDSSEATRPRSPLKKLTSHIPSVFADKENLVASPAAHTHGKKRSIEEVEDAEKPDSGKMLAHTRDESMWNSGMPLTADAMQQHTVCQSNIHTPHQNAHCTRIPIQLPSQILDRPLSAIHRHQSPNPSTPLRKAISLSPTY